MSIVDAVIRTGRIPPVNAPRVDKKRYSEVMSKHLAEEVAEGLRLVGFVGTKPDRDGPGEKAFQGGLGPKKVDVSYSDDRHGLMLAISIKTICFPEYGKNLKNRFSDMCAEAITLHMRFPYSVIGGMFAFPVGAANDTSKARKVSTFDRATKLFSTVSGRDQHGNALEKFENFTMLQFQPVDESGVDPWISLVDCVSGRKMSEDEYFDDLKSRFLTRNPHIDL